VSLTDNVERNRRLAERIACGDAPLDAAIEKTLREQAEAFIDIPGPRFLQVYAELHELRIVVARVHAQLGVALYGKG